MAQQLIQHSNKIQEQSECKRVTKTKSDYRKGQLDASPLSGMWRCKTAHRLSFMVFNQAMDITGKDISHLCHNKPCVRGKHLSAETQAVSNARQKSVNRCCCNPLVCLLF